MFLRAMLLASMPCVAAAMRDQTETAVKAQRRDAEWLTQNKTTMAESAEDTSSLLSIKGKVTARGSAERAQFDSLALAGKFASAAESEPELSTTKALLQSFRICGQCSNYQRFGEGHDGGYLMCMDGLSKDSMKAAYSLGVEHHDQWSEDVIKHLNLPVSQFDCTVSSSLCSQNHAQCKFFKKCIVSSDGKHPMPGHEQEGLTLNQVLQQTGQEKAADGSLLMKMDIEASEWPIYAVESQETLKKFGELIVEFHWLDQKQNHPQYLKAMQHILAAGFKVAHLHGNNFGGMYTTSNGATIPNVVEVTFVQGAARPGGCDDNQEYDKTLDTPNNENLAELPMAHFG